MLRKRSRVDGCLLLVAIALPVGLLACAASSGPAGERHRWWAGLGPVLSHDTFPADCALCHEGDGWDRLREDFGFDHAARTGVALRGAHAAARCLRCHNDRGPVEVFAAKGCSGCHADPHRGDLGPECATCHDERTWHARGQVELHSRTRFPLTGAHVAVACHRCHPGFFHGKIRPVDSECVTCHRDELAGTNDPPHVPLGWVDRCHRCHLPTRWHQARIR